jgi:hypothetical protein
MKSNKLFSLFIALFIGISSYAQNKPLNAYVIGFYNLENLFDTIDDPIKNDAQFLPDGDYTWGTMKYTNKLQKMAYAISQMPKNLAILGVSEIENINVLEDLVKEPAISNRKLKPILIEGPDKRGIDVGLLYNTKLFKPTNITSTRMQSELENFFTRDQLCVSGILDGEEIHIIVNHWPSRSGGEERSKPRRAEAARTTKHICDSLFAINPNAKIVVMGDLNDDPIDPSITKELGAKSKIEDTKIGELFNTTYAFYKQGIGTLAYKDQWNLFDQIIISQAWLNTDRKSLSYWKTEIFNKDFLKQQDGRYKGYPLRTHAGGVWANGYSDHFPCLIWVVKYKK